MNIAYLTGNTQKFEEAEHILSSWHLERAAVDLEEIQGDADAIVCHKASEALRLLDKPLIVEDVSMSCSALGGLPGPYIKDFLRKLGDVGLYRVAHACGDTKAQVSCLAAYIEPGCEPKLFEGKLEGTLVEPRGDMRHGTYSWNCIFLPDGMDKTMGEMTMAEHAAVSMRKMALEKLKKYLEERA